MNKMKLLFENWKNSYKARRKYSLRLRDPFFDLAYEYLPARSTATIVDIGAGDGAFAKRGKLNEKYDRLYLLDGNKTTVENLKAQYKNVVHWRTGQEMPFEDSSVSFVHCSHLIEHLEPAQLYSMLEEVDRALDDGGVLVISAPLLWNKFYNGLSHIKPYNPEVLLKYIGGGSRANRWTDAISQSYTLLKLVYRYRVLDFEDGELWGSNIFSVDIMMQFVKRVLYKVGFRRYQKNGYTIVFKKAKSKN